MTSGSLISAYRSSRLKRAWTAGLILAAALFATAVWRITLGEWDIPLPRVAYLLSPWLPDAERTTAEALLVRSVRLPRLLSAIGTGGLLSVAGAVLQGLLSNPLAEPYTLGIAAGAAFGGSLGLLFGAGVESAATVWLGACVVFLPAFACARRLDAISLGPGRGVLLGVNEGRLRASLLLTTSLGVAAAVSSFGIIGFVGLVVPHLLRLCVGPSHRALLPLSFLAGGCLLAGADGFAQRLGELPVGVLTAIIGGPFFCWLLIRRGKRP